MKAIIIQLLILIAIGISINGCKVDPDKTAQNNQEEIESRIQADLADGLSSISNIKLDQANLPKTVLRSDKAHSSISFKTKHWEIVDLIGWFTDFEVVMYSDKTDFTDAVIYAVVNPQSIAMPNIKMSGSAQKVPYIDSENHPQVSFKSTSMRLIKENHYSLSGIFNMNGIDKEVNFKATYNGHAYPGEKSICGFDIEGKINRHDFKIAGNSRLHSGRKMHNDTIYLNMAMRME